MALSPSLSNYTVFKGVAFPKEATISAGNCSQVLMGTSSSLNPGKLVLSKSISGSDDLIRSRVCPNEKLFRKGLSRNGSHFHALETENALNTEKAFPFSNGERFQLDDILDAQQFDRDILTAIFNVACEMENVEKNSPESQILRGFLMATLFYEPSTRTRLSFESAMKRLGGEVLTTENAREFSSAAKGETLEDTIRTVEGYSDIIVIRHFENGAARRAAETAGIPVINAGDGPGQHPSQEYYGQRSLMSKDNGLSNTKTWQAKNILKTCQGSRHVQDMVKQLKPKA